MTISFNPQVKLSSGVSFKQDPAAAAPTFTEQPPVAGQVAAQPKPSGVKGFFAGISYAWINLTEDVQGAFKGVFAGFVTGTAIAGVDGLVSGAKKIGRKELKIGEAFRHPTRALGKVGKFLAPLAGLAVLVGFIIKARLTANLKTANVDHALNTGHRAENKS